ncbi:MAG: 3'-5' exonuclease, partial [Ruminiclostridium sp.]|nr:3'-5' exonuclease [Ruminiclostridium sp.]
IETTGLSTNFDNIIEIGAVRVKDGIITDKFQTLVHPMDRKITEEAQKISGISNEDVKDAPDNKTAFNAFADFIGDDILVGFNNHRFDDKFIVRSGRYAHRIISNKSFDTMVYARNFKDKLTFTDDKISLESCCKQLSVTNEKAHQALSDAEATARVYLKLLQMDNGSKASLDDILSDDDWE